jgi:beta-N-acetylhexosaminidase
MSHLRNCGALAIVVMLLGCQSLLAVDVRGKITTVSVNPSNPAIGSVLIEGKLEKDTSVDKASTRVTAQTKVFRMQDGKKVAATFGDLKVGQTVEATFTGPVAESYPVQAAAGEIVILEAR